MAVNKCLKNKQAAEVLSFLAFKVCGLCTGQWPCVRDNREDSCIRLGVAQYGKQLNIFFMLGIRKVKTSETV